MSDRKTGYSPLNAESNRNGTNNVIFAYTHEKIADLFIYLFIYLFILNISV